MGIYVDCSSIATFGFQQQPDPAQFTLNIPPQSPVPQPPLQDAPISAAALCFDVLALLGTGYALYSALAEANELQRRCSGCGSTSHDRRTCNHIGKRRHFSRSIPRSKRCECCGMYGYETYRHHPRGRADDSDWLDVCNGCHLQCGHKGDYYNAATKPRYCLFTGEAAFWRTV